MFDILIEGLINRVFEVSLLVPSLHQQATEVININSIVWILKKTRSKDLKCSLTVFNFSSNKATFFCPKLVFSKKFRSAYTKEATVWKTCDVDLLIGPIN